MTTLLIAEHDNAVLNPSTCNALTAAAQIGGPVHVLVAGFQCQPIIDQVKVFSDVEKIIHLDSDCYNHLLPETLSHLIHHLSSDYTHIVAAATTFGKNIMPRAAALCDVGQVSDLIEIIDEKTFVRPIYAGNILTTVVSHDPIKILTVRPTAFSASIPAQHEASVVTLDFKVENPLSEFVNVHVDRSDRPELTQADIVVSGGRGLQDSETFERLTAIADRLGAAIGASRAAVDAGLAPNDWQVGQTGKVVAPSLYIAVGISGAIQHLAGMKDSKVIVAINKDADAPIFQIADYGLVADLNKVLPEWEAVLTELGY